VREESFKGEYRAGGRGGGGVLRSVVRVHAQRAGAAVPKSGERRAYKCVMHAAYLRAARTGKGVLRDMPGVRTEFSARQWCAQRAGR